MWHLPVRRIACALAVVIMAGPAAAVFDDVTRPVADAGGDVAGEVFGSSTGADHVLLRSRVDVGRIGGERQPGNPSGDDRVGPLERRMQRRVSSSAAAAPVVQPFSPVVDRRHVISLRAPPLDWRVTT